MVRQATVWRKPGGTRRIAPAPGERAETLASLAGCMRPVHPMSDGRVDRGEPHKLSWKDGLFLVGPDPMTSLFYSSGALIVAGVGYATPLFQVGLYALLFILAPLYIEAVLLTLSNGGTYVMTRYALNRFGNWATVCAAAVGVIISFSYVATAIVSLLSYSDYLMSLFSGFDEQVPISIVASAIPAIGFGVWVMPTEWRATSMFVGATTLVALALSTIMPAAVVVMLAPLTLLFRLNNYGLRESVKVSRSIFLVNIAVMSLTILLAVVYVLLHGADWDRFIAGAELPASVPAPGGGGLHALPGLGNLGAALIPAALGSSILGASGVESVMNIPEELSDPRSCVPKIYRWMLSILLVIGGSTAILLFPRAHARAAHGRERLPAGHARPHRGRGPHGRAVARTDVPPRHRRERRADVDRGHEHRLRGRARSLGHHGARQPLAALLPGSEPARFLRACTG